MTLGRKIFFIAGVAVAVVALGSVVVSQYQPQAELMSCGHPNQISLKTRIKIMMGGHDRHFCQSRDMVMRLQILAGNDVSYLDDQLAGGSDYFRGLKYIFATNGSNWFITVPRQDKLAGHYLLTSAGRLHFHTTRPATTNDSVLQDWSR